ncbi:MAG: archaemetzincin [Pyrinomonadaceae bacterium]
MSKSFAREFREKTRMEERSIFAEPAFFYRGSIKFFTRVLSRNSRALLLLLTAVAASCSNTEDKPASNMAAAREAKKEIKQLRDNMAKVAPFFKVMGKPDNSDWLASHNEPGQTFEEYFDADPVKPTKERQKIYVLPLGTFNAKQQMVIEVAAGYLAVFYDLPVEQMAAKPLVAVYPNIRQNKFTKTRQIKTGFILNDILPNILPTDAAALIAFTTDDLYPDESMNYVFGQASLENRVGVWSLSRLDDNTDDLGFLRRTLKIAAHETGHMFSMRHCTKYECVMSGTNHLAETDRRPIDACPECTAKICWLSDADQVERYENLAVFCRKNGLNKEAEEFGRKSDVLKKD